jgi:hypothetical protein
MLNRLVTGSKSTLGNCCRAPKIHHHRRNAGGDSLGESGAKVGVRPERKSSPPAQQFSAAADAPDGDFCPRLGPAGYLTPFGASFFGAFLLI